MQVSTVGRCTRMRGIPVYRMSRRTIYVKWINWDAGVNCRYKDVRHTSIQDVHENYPSYMSEWTELQVSTVGRCTTMRGIPLYRMSRRIIQVKWTKMQASTVGRCTRMRGIPVYRMSRRKVDQLRKLLIENWKYMLACRHASRIYAWRACLLMEYVLACRHAYEQICMPESLLFQLRTSSNLITFMFVCLNKCCRAYIYCLHIIIYAYVLISILNEFTYMLTCVHACYACNDRLS